MNQIQGVLKEEMNGHIEELKRAFEMQQQDLRHEMMNVKRQADELMEEKLRGQDEINKLKVQIREKTS